MGILSLEARNIMLVNRITSTIEEQKLISENMKPNVIRCYILSQQAPPVSYISDMLALKAR